MKHTGIVRNLDKLGRICVPIELRRQLGLVGKLEICLEEGAIVIKKHQPGPEKPGRAKKD